jgi:hypothetical protein
MLCDFPVRGAILQAKPAAKSRCPVWNRAQAGSVRHQSLAAGAIEVSRVEEARLGQGYAKATIPTMRSSGSLQVGAWTSF